MPWRGALSIDHPNLAVTGDPDQSIYGWRGANLNNILEFERDFPDVRVVRLERNYRSTKRILHVAADLIAHNVKRKRKDLFTENVEGPPVRLVTYGTHDEEAKAVAAQIAEEVHAGRRRPRDFAVFYRVNALSRSVEMALREQGMPYQLVNGIEFFQRKEIRDVLAYLRLLDNPRDDVALQRVINAPPRGIGKITLQRLAEYASTRALSLLEAARACRDIPRVSSRSAAGVLRFVDMLDRLALTAVVSVEETLGYVLAESGYKKQFESNREEDQQRLANIEELFTAAREFDERNHGDRHLEEFLEQTSLAGDTDDWETESDRVTLMTLHASKGLEFPVVFLIALEEGLLPHERSREHPDQLEEERRLLFVGITRAQQELQISLARSRDFRGQRKPAVPSSFLMELPRAEMALTERDSETAAWRAAAEDAHAEPFYLPPASLPDQRPLAPRADRSPSSIPHLVTAAELGQTRNSPRNSPDDFHQGMLVRHPEHGLGRIVALGGSGPFRSATVDFLDSAARRKFILAHSPLRPVTG